MPQKEAFKLTWIGNRAVLHVDKARFFVDSITAVVDVQIYAEYYTVVHLGGTQVRVGKTFIADDILDFLSHQQLDRRAA
jgi:hypothetical protein